MFRSNLTKFFAAFALISTFFSACGWWQNSSVSNSSGAPPVSDELKSEIPFSTAEPERFQAEIVVTAGESERKTFIARNGAARRYDFNFGKQNQLTNLQTDKNYLIYAGKKIYTENANSPAIETDDWNSFLTTRWLSEKAEAAFEKLETAENTTKYRVLLGDGASSEIYVFVDEKTGLPVRQEFYALGGEQKFLAYSFELKNLKLETDENFFAVPTGYKKVSAEEFQKITQGEK